MYQIMFSRTHAPLVFAAHTAMRPHHIRPCPRRPVSYLLLALQADRSTTASRLLCPSSLVATVVVATIDLPPLHRPDTPSLLLLSNTNKLPRYVAKEA